MQRYKNIEGVVASVLGEENVVGVSFVGGNDIYDIALERVTFEFFEMLNGEMYDDIYFRSLYVIERGDRYFTDTGIDSIDGTAVLRTVASNE